MVYEATKLIQITEIKTNDSHFVFLEPFSKEVWIALFLIYFGGIVVSAIIDSSKNFEDINSFLEFARHKFVDGIEFDRESVTSQTNMFLGFWNLFCFLAIIMYEANLMSFLIYEGTVNYDYTSLIDVARDNEKICVLHAYMNSIVSRYDGLRTEHFYSDIQDRNDIPQAIIDGHCKVAIVEDEDLARQHMSGKFCNMQMHPDEQLVLGQAFPVNQK